MRDHGVKEIKGEEDWAIDGTRQKGSEKLGEQTEKYEHPAESARVYRETVIDADIQTNGQADSSAEIEWGGQKDRGTEQNNNFNDRNVHQSWL